MSSALTLVEVWKSFVASDVAELTFSTMGSEPLRGVGPRLNEFKKLPFSLLNQERYFKAPELKGNEMPSFLIQWNFSRVVLAETLDQALGQDLKASEVLMSLSHSKEAAVAVVAKEGFLKGIGVDLELKTRVISPRASEKFIAASEVPLGLSALQMWVIKEACYKAYSKNKTTVIPYYRILTVVQKNNLIQGEVSVQFENSTEEPLLKYCLISHEQWWIAFAKYFD